MDRQNPAVEPLAAHCAIHRGQPFTAVCVRCGTYMCSACTEGGHFDRCAACRARTGTGILTLRRDDFTLDAVMRHAYAAYRKNLGVMTLAMGTMFALVMLTNALGTAIQQLVEDAAWSAALSIVLLVPESLLQGLLTLGLLSMALAAARGDPVELGQLFGGGRLLGGWLLQWLLIYLPLLPVLGCAALIGWWFEFELSDPSLLLALGALGVVSIPVLLYFFLGVTFANAELVAQPRVSALSALRNAWRITHGKRLVLCMCFALVFVLCVAGMLACFVGLVFATGYASVLFATLYLVLRNGADGLEDA